ncbi:hypothetical protein GCM10008107_32060 [Psychrosphaera saromensis]|uniref:hypothetical protein n=1 Tax=Psychrosphaera saromensis TaxID=716813 RepID=UPI0015E355AF|nr:hypothetical protein [Psychrosphaera saromensis]GHB80290.1 hypothetical protein GCM10008107_32060 [Psychrosphaera saromensis]GLQ15219.1 hypothetical protein GCM10007917_26740 [Psychrosphaera saromensis]
MRELNVNEIEQVNGGFIVSAIKAIVKSFSSKNTARAITVLETTETLVSDTETAK